MKLNKGQEEALEMFIKFANDKDGWEMFINGQAGCGKTVLLGTIVQKLIDKHIPHIVCAYTHKAKDILISKLPPQADVRTLHSFLKKRPGINENAMSTHHLQTTGQFGKPEEVKIVIIDEYSMVGEKDVMSLGELQDPDNEGKCIMKILWTGDWRQLSPVKDTFILQPNNSKYSYTLREVMRQDSGPLLDTICEVVDMIDGNTPIHRLEPNAEFHRDADIVKLFNPLDDGIILAFTNKRVEELNKLIAAKDKEGTLDRWSPTLKMDMTYQHVAVHPETILVHAGEYLERDSKYKTLEHLESMKGIEFGVFNIDGEEHNLAYVFGHYQYKLMNDVLGELAAQANAEIGKDAASYCRQNWQKSKCKARAKAWRNYLAFKNNVMCIDYPYAQTIHKSQGSTFETVYVDNEDLKMLLNRGNTQQYLKLLYVAISRASDSVYLS